MNILNVGVDGKLCVNPFEYRMLHRLFLWIYFQYIFFGNCIVIYTIVLQTGGIKRHYFAKKYIRSSFEQLHEPLALIHLIHMINMLGSSKYFIGAHSIITSHYSLQCSLQLKNNTKASFNITCDYRVQDNMGHPSTPNILNSLGLSLSRQSHHQQVKDELLPL